VLLQPTWSQVLICHALVHVYFQAEVVTLFMVTQAEVGKRVGSLQEELKRATAQAGLDMSQQLQIMRDRSAFVCLCWHCLDALNKQMRKTILASCFGAFENKHFMKDVFPFCVTFAILLA
jgi:hypothetical protein